MQVSALQSLVKAQGSGGSQTVSVPADLFRTLLISALRAKGEFDEAYYLAANPDIRAAIRNGTVASGAEHYFNSGYFEGKMPRRIEVDEAFYLDRNPDVAKAIAQKKVKNCQAHFESNGYREGRAPHEGFSLF